MKQLPALALLLCALSCAPAQARQVQETASELDMPLTAADRQLLINSLVSEMHSSYVFPDMAKKVDVALRQHQQRGTYRGITSALEMSKALTRDLQATTKDKHLNVYYSAKPLPARTGEEKPTPEAAAAELKMQRYRNFGVERIERLPFNIGLLRLDGFFAAKDAADTLAAAMTALAHTDALIIDLRNNGGGDPATVALLASYLLDKRTHLSDIYYRRGKRTEQIWSADAVPGTRYGQDKAVYVLTSKDTFSAAEDFSYALQSMKRVTVVGETTGGGAHPGDFMRLTPHFSAFVPNGRTIGAVTKSNWEGVGVTPDIRVSAGHALHAAQSAILTTMAGTEKDPERLARIRERLAVPASEAPARQ